MLSGSGVSDILRLYQVTEKKLSILIDYAVVNFLYMVFIVLR